MTVRQQQDVVGESSGSQMVDSLGQSREDCRAVWLAEGYDDRPVVRLGTHRHGVKEVLVRGKEDGAMILSQLEQRRVVAALDLRAADIKEECPAAPRIEIARFGRFSSRRNVMP